MHVFVSSFGVVTVAVYITACVLQLPCRGHCALLQQFGKGSWKQRYSQHKLSFNSHKYKQITTLPKFIWNTKKTNRISTRNFLVHLKVYPSLQQHQQTMFTLPLRKTFHRHIHTPNPTPEQKIGTLFKMQT